MWSRVPTTCRRGFIGVRQQHLQSWHLHLAPEIKGFGIKVTLIEPGAYATDFGSPSSLKIAPGMDAYADLRQRVFGGLSHAERGDPHATAEAIPKVVDAEQPPLRFILGSESLPRARAAYADRLATWEAWEAVSNAAQGEPKKAAAPVVDQT